VKRPHILRSDTVVSERRACRVIDADRKSVPYRFARDDDAGSRETLRELAKQRRRSAIAGFGSCCAGRS